MTDRPDPLPLDPFDIDLARLDHEMRRLQAELDRARADHWWCGVGMASGLAIAGGAMALIF